jgi:hypothetical protein
MPPLPSDAEPRPPEDFAGFLSPQKSYELSPVATRFTNKVWLAAPLGAEFNQLPMAGNRVGGAERGPADRHIQPLFPDVHADEGRRLCVRVFAFHRDGQHGSPARAGGESPEYLVDLVPLVACALRKWSGPLAPAGLKPRIAAGLGPPPRAHADLSLAGRRNPSKCVSLPNIR